MQKILLKMAKPGMKLAKPVVNDRGMTLCGEGTALTEETISRLIRMEVKQITVKGHPVQGTGSDKPLAQQLEEIDARFRKVEANPVMKKIKDILVRQLREGAEEE